VAAGSAGTGSASGQAATATVAGSGGTVPGSIVSGGAGGGLNANGQAGQAGSITGTVNPGIQPTAAEFQGGAAGQVVASTTGATVTWTVAGTHN